MSEEKNLDKKLSMNGGKSFDTNAFIQGIAQSGGSIVVDKSVDKSFAAPVQTDTEKEMQELTDDKPAKRKRGQAVDYESQFLSRNEIRTRQGLYIDRENYETLQTLVRSIRSERVSVSGLVDNIVRHHIELYGDEINRIYDENNRKPVKNSK
ncbi:MAG: DUF3408 domain-containing protein [Candidatus Azobacteroides sp.]|nr:DUF3408 domain-containing protein [Candidatus Azobacteroides sp.]